MFNRYCQHGRPNNPSSVTVSQMDFLPEDIAKISGYALFVVGVLLNLWTLKALGIKGMYNGDSFGHLMPAPVTDGPYAYLSDPQYVGTTMAMLGSAVVYRSWIGIVVTAWMGLVFWASVHFVEGPHMARIYAKKS